MRTVLFVCTGNTCRSPMAEGIARYALERDPAFASLKNDAFIASAGVAASDGLPTTRETQQALSAMGIEIETRSKPLNAAMIRKADWVVCMTASQQAAARELVRDEPEQQRKIVLLDASGGDVSDPIGMGQDAYDALARRLQAAIPGRLRELLPPSADVAGTQNA